jgi:hypothetical protein
MPWFVAEPAAGLHSPVEVDMIMGSASCWFLKGTGLDSDTASTGIAKFALKSLYMVLGMVHLAGSWVLDGEYRQVVVKTLPVVNKADCWF